MRKRPHLRGGSTASGVAAMFLLLLAATVSGAAPAAPEPPRLIGLRVSNGGKPFAGDGPLLASISPNRDGLRDHAIVRFYLDRPATVDLQVVTTNEVRRPIQPVWQVQRSLAVGPHAIVWTPKRGTPARTYLFRFAVTGPNGGSRVYGYERPRRGLKTSGVVVRVLGVEAGFLQRSYVRGASARLSIATDAKSIRLQLISFANVARPTLRDLRTGGVAVAPAVKLDWRRHRNAPHVVEIATAASGPSGLFFVRVTTSDGRVGYAPLILRPQTLGEHRIAVVFSTNTWQAYNFLDENGDGWGDSWYVGGATRAVDLRRPYLDFGVPYRFRDWDLAFVSWLKRTGKDVDYLSDDDLEHVRNGAALRRAYSLVVFPGHEEYVTEHAYDVLLQYRNLGGHLIFLSANNIFWKARREGQLLRRLLKWRDLGRPEAALVGVQYAASNYLAPQQPYTVVGATVAPWVFAGTGLANGSRFGHYGYEIDARAAATPPGTVVLARASNAIGNHDAEMTYYETPAGAKVFAGGALNFPASITDPAVSRLVENVWSRLSTGKPLVSP